METAQLTCKAKGQQQAEAQIERACEINYQGSEKTSRVSGGEKVVQGEGR